MSLLIQKSIFHLHFTCEPGLFSSQQMNKSADGLPDYHKTARKFSRINT